VNPAAPQVRIELIAEWGDPVNVDVDHQRFSELGLKLCKEVFCTRRKAGSSYQI